MTTAAKSAVSLYPIPTSSACFPFLTSTAATWVAVAFSILLVWILGCCSLRLTKDGHAARTWPAAVARATGALKNPFLVCLQPSLAHHLQVFACSSVRSMWTIKTHEYTHIPPFVIENASGEARSPRYLSCNVCADGGLQVLRERRHLECLSSHLRYAIWSFRKATAATNSKGQKRKTLRCELPLTYHAFRLASPRSAPSRSAALLFQYRETQRVHLADSTTTTTMTVLAASEAQTAISTTRSTLKSSRSSQWRRLRVRNPSSFPLSRGYPRQRR